ncbi:ankyrin [Neocallimastix californiae]|uniref:Ankyrin n=1 Tax=Neocallimastix californiae TaxID=1754190 RepID=A0A1Y2BY57_9FUNG|nr:ankyrin [Neocallimastix californiae]|eukprot:ORY39709.1 ankyrin [Neocallimastix californiae]
MYSFFIYVKLFEKDNIQKNSKKSKSTSKKSINKKSATRNNNSYGLKLYNFIESLNNIELMDKLLTTNPNIANQRDKNGNTPLMLSINYNKDELLISKLLSYTSDINARNSNGDNCLMLAIENGNKKIVDLIMQTDINVNNQNNQNESPLFSAIAKGRIDIVSSLMSTNINLNVRNKNGKIPIEEALSTENVELIKTLIENGASTLIKDINDEYILFQLMPHPEFLKDIIEIESRSPNKKNLILTLRNREGNTLFMEFCRHGYIKLAKFMMKHRTDINCINHGENALTLAIREGQLEIVKLLLTCRSIDVHHVTSDKKSPIRIAIEKQNIPIIKALINYGGHLLLKNENENLLKDAIHTTNIDIINLLLDININVDVKFGLERNTPLIYTIKKIIKDLNIIDTSEGEILSTKHSLFSATSTSNIDSDIDKNKEETDHMSVSSSNSSVTTLAINKSISITDNNYYSGIFSNMENEEEEQDYEHELSPYDYDSDDTLSDTENCNDKTFEEENSHINNNNSFSGHDEIIDEKIIINTDIPMLSHKASFDKHYKVHDMSIMVDQRYCDIVKALLRYHAKVNLTNNSKDTALILACRYGLKNVVEVLVRESRQYHLDLDLNMADHYGNTALHNACKKNYTSIVQLLLSEEDNINVNIQNQNGNTALMIAVYENNIEIIHELLKCKNININTLNVQLETPLIAACRMNNYKIAKILLDNKAIINKRYDMNGETAIFHSIRNNNKKLTGLLLDNEAYVSFKNKSGKSPLAIAKEYKFKGIVSMLFSHFKNLSSLKNKNSTLSLNENVVRSDDKKAFFNKNHSRNASLNISNLSSGNGISIINELKNSYKPSLKVNHNHNNSITFGRNIMNTPMSVSTAATYGNKKHSRHESFNEGITNKANYATATRRINGHARHKKGNHFTNKTSDSISANETERTFFSPTKSKRFSTEVKSHHLHSPDTMKNSTESHKKSSRPSLKKSFRSQKKAPKIYEEPKSDGEESDTEFTTNLLLERAKEKVQNEIIAAAATPIATSKHTKYSKSKSSNSIRGESKSDDYIKPLKTACYNQNIEDVEKFYETLIKEKGNLYQLPEDLFQQIKNCKDGKEREKITQRIKEYNKQRSSSYTILSIETFVFTLLYFSDSAEALEIMLKYGLNPNIQNNAINNNNNNNR